MTDLEVAVQSLWGPTNKVIYDDAGLPSIMVEFAKGNISDVITSGSENTHPAFSVDLAEKPRFYASKFQNVVITCGDGIQRGYSLPYQDPAVYVNFDSACHYSSRKGLGWHLMTNAEWAWIALQCRKNGYMPTGNNSYGKDHSKTYQKGVPTYIDGNGTICRTATGSGPKAWAHNNDPSGVYDLNGNIWEWVGGYRTMDGEIQIIPYNNAANRDNPQNAESTLWKAILPNGDLVDPGTPGTLKWDYDEDPGETGSKSFHLATSITHKQSVEAPYGARTFQSMTATGVTAPEILKALAIYPADSGDHGGDYIYMRNLGERLATRGGYWGDAGNAGVFDFHGGSLRSDSYYNLGFRSAYVEL